MVVIVLIELIQSPRLPKSTERLCQVIGMCVRVCVQHRLPGAGIIVLHRHVHVSGAQAVQRMLRRMQLVVLA